MTSSNDRQELILNENEVMINANCNKDDLQIDLQNIIYGGNAVLLEGNQYYIHSNDVEAVILNANDENETIVTENDEESIQFIQTDLESNSNVFYSVGGKRLKLENGKIFNLDGLQQFTDELGILNQVNGRESSVQYAVIKDGQLHLQLSEDDTVEILNNNDFIQSENENALEICLNQENKEINRYVSAKTPCILKKSRNHFKNHQKNYQFNLIESTVSTGNDEIEVMFNPETQNINQIGFIKSDDNIQVIFDENLLKTQQNLIETDEISLENNRNEQILIEPNLNLNQISELNETDNFLNQKFTIGRKPNGKCLVGRILNIQTPQNQANFDYQSDNFVTGNCKSTESENVEETIFNFVTESKLPSENHRSKYELTQNQLDFVSKTLNGLAELPTLQRKLIDTNLEIKLIEKVIDNETKKCSKKINEFLGVLIEYVDDENNENEKFYRFNVLNEPEVSIERKTSLIIGLNITKMGENKEKMSTKVTFLDEKHQKIDKINQIVCGICSKSFKNQNLLLKHASTAHLDQIQFDLKSSFSKNGEKCDENDLLLVCFQCNKSFKSMSELNSHKKCHGIGSNKFFYCETCGRQFSRHSNLIRHEVIHNGEGNLYNCTICGSSYKFVSSLTRHIVQNHVGKN